MSLGHVALIALGLGKRQEGAGGCREHGTVQMTPWLRSRPIDRAHRSNDESFELPYLLAADPARMEANALDPLRIVRDAELRLAIYPCDEPRDGIAALVHGQLLHA